MESIHLREKEADMASDKPKQSMPEKIIEKGKEELPLESSPYVKYTDLEDYKDKAYGAHGHRQPVENARTGGTTDGPTLSGTDLSPAQVVAVDLMNRSGAV